MNPLAAGQSESATLDVTLPTALTNGAGTYYVIGKADANSNVSEANEANNNKVSAVLTLQAPDLTVSALSTSKSGVGPGESF
ncbi:CARDB domain-containing protein [Accumulibacter sp.]|uniref:CARDB domain-containing protein n=1 Tax=Accumulibacter sp. TaxID=2053492 RepID=UPI00338FADAE